MFRWRPRLLLPFVLCGVTAAQAVPAGQSVPPGPTHAGMQPGMGQSFVPANPEVAAGDEAMRRMMQAMSKPPTGDADQDFVGRMLPQHQGAVDVAKVELKYGTDPQLRKLATRIVESQTADIAFMQAWAAKHKPSINPKIDNPRIQYK